MSVEVTETGKFRWNVKEALDEGKLNPVRFGRYVARFRIKQKKTPLKTNVVISMQWQCSRIPAILNKDKRTLSMIFKLSKGAAIGWETYDVRMFKKYSQIFHENLARNEINRKDIVFFMDWKLNVDSGFDKQQIQSDTNLSNYLETLFKNVLANGDVKIFYQVTNDENTNNSNNSKQPKKRRKLNDGTITLDEYEEKEKDNYILMCKWLLAAQSDYFKTYVHQKQFGDAGRIDFCGNKAELLAFIRFIVTGVVSSDVNPLRLCNIAGAYGIVRLQKALVILIVAGLTVNNFVTTMNTLIKNNTYDNVYSEIVNFGVEKYTTLKHSRDWRKLNGIVRNNIVMMYQGKHAK